MKGWELLKEIAEENIKEGTKFKMMENDKYFYYDGYELRYEDGKVNILADYTITTVIQSNFEIIEEQEETTITIQDIEELDVKVAYKEYDPMTNDTVNVAFVDKEEIFVKKINELIKAIKQLDKEIKEIKNNE